MSRENRLSRLGLSHLIDDPAALEKALQDRIAKRDAEVREGTAEKERIRNLRRDGNRPAMDSVQTSLNSDTLSGGKPMAAASPQRKPEQLPTQAGSKGGGAPKRVKSSTLIVATKSPGPCAGCRHSNQGTRDFEEGHLFCEIAHTAKKSGQSCDVQWPLPAKAGGAYTPYFLFQRFDGTNCTYCVTEDRRVITEDADDELRRQAEADKPYISAD